MLCSLSGEGKTRKIYDITHFGAVADSTVVNTEAIQSAIDQCAKGGGGTVVVPAGIYLSGALFFKQDVNLEITAGGILKGTTNLADYRLVQTRWEGEERIWVSALVNVFDMTGFRMSGEGVLEGSGDIWFSPGRRRPRGSTPATEASPSVAPRHPGPHSQGPPALGVKGGLPAAPGSPAFDFRDVELPEYARPRLIAIQNCKDVVVENLTLRNPASWCLFVLYSRNVKLRNLVIRAEHYIPSSDGIDIDSSERVTISKVDIDVNDDCIAIKSGKDEDGRRVNRPAENIVVDNCRFRYGHGGVSMGSEMSGGIRNVVIRNCVMEADNWAPIRFKSQPSRGGVVENITYRNILLKNTRQAFEFNMAWRMVPPVKPPSDPLPLVRDIKIINVSGDVASAGFMHGLPGSPVENVKFKNCAIRATKGLVLDHVKNLDLSGLDITVEEGEAIIRKNITGESAPSSPRAASFPEISNPDASEVAKAFTDPPAEFSLSFYWGWDGEVTEEVIARDLDEFKSKNVRIVTLEPGYNMPHSYLSPGWFEGVRSAVRLAKERDMRVYLVDEGKYPSGFAGGKIVSAAPALCMKALVTDTVITAAGGQTISLPLSEEVVSTAVFNKTDSTTLILEIHDGKPEWTAPDGEWQVFVVKHAFRSSPTRSVNNPTRGKDARHALIDYLDPAATRKFLEFTHEEYKKVVGEEFGKTVLGFRGDEPDYSIRGIPWTPRLFDEFEKQKGYDVRPYTSSFFTPRLTEEQRKAKADYWDVWSSLFAENFFKVQAEWCAVNGLDYLVHLNHEENMVRLVRSEGDFFRNMSSVQLPGVDAIWHQIWPGEVNPVFPKYASSSAHLNGHPRSFTESFAAYNPQPDLNQAKWILDQQLVRGINMVEIMFVMASTRGTSGMRGWLADERFPEVAKYIHRASYLLSQGIPAAPIAVLYPASAIWLGDNEKDMSAQEAMQALLDNQHDFDVIDEHALTSVLKPGNGKLMNRSGQAYSAVVIPPVSALSEKSISRLKEFEKSGGKVITLGKDPIMAVDRSFMNGSETRPEWAVNEPSGKVTPRVLDVLPPSDFMLETPCESVKYTHRKWKDSDLYFIFNEGDESRELQVTLAGKGVIQEWDAMTGEITPVSGKNGGKDRVVTRLNLEPRETRFLVVGGKGK